VEGKVFERCVEYVVKPADSGISLTLGPKLLAREVVGWKWLQHENILPFVGVTPELAIVSDLMGNGNIMEFINKHPRYNRLHLVSDGRMCNIPI